MLKHTNLSLDFIQKVTFPTHIHGHTLALVLTKPTFDSISYIHVHHSQAFSDYFSTSFTLNLTIPRSQTDNIVIFVNTIELTKKKKSSHFQTSYNPHKADFLYPI